MSERRDSQDAQARKPVESVAQVMDPVFAQLTGQRRVRHSTDDSREEEGTSNLSPQLHDGKHNQRQLMRGDVGSAREPEGTVVR